MGCSKLDYALATFPDAGSGFAFASTRRTRSSAGCGTRQNALPPHHFHRPANFERPARLSGEGRNRTEKSATAARLAAIAPGGGAKIKIKNLYAEAWLVEKSARLGGQEE